MWVEINLQIELESPLHVGSGSLADAIADKPLIKDTRRLPLIPGSSIKGKARHISEQIARALVAGRDLICDAPYPGRMCQGDDLNQLCPICQIFGAPGYPAPVRFGNLSLQLAEGLPQPRGWELTSDSEVRAGVGLSRAQRTAQEDILYSVETHRPSAALVFQGRIYGELAEKRQVALLVAGLRAIRTLGGNRSRGLGWCSLTPTVNLDGAEENLSELLKELEQWSN